MSHPWRRPLCLLAALLIGCTADAPRQAADEAEASASPLANGSFTAELNGFPIHYAVHGSGPVLMTVPNSWGLSLEGLRALYRPLEERLTLVYFDPRGMGSSGAVREEADRGLEAVRADFQALREHLGLDAVHAIGWSNGAANLIFLAHERPALLGHLPPQRRELHRRGRPAHTGRVPRAHRCRTSWSTSGATPSSPRRRRPRG